MKCLRGCSDCLQVDPAVVLRLLLTITLLQHEDRDETGVDIDDVLSRQIRLRHQFRQVLIKNLLEAHSCILVLTSIDIEASKVLVVPIIFTTQLFLDQVFFPQGVEPRNEFAIMHELDLTLARRLFQPFHSCLLVLLLRND